MITCKHGHLLRQIPCRECKKMDEAEADSALIRKQDDVLIGQHQELMKLRSQLDAELEVLETYKKGAEMQRDELMSLRLKVLLLEQRPTTEAHNNVREACKSARRLAANLTTEVQVLRTVNDTLLAKLNTQERVPGTQTLGRRKRDALDAQMLAARAMIEDELEVERGAPRPCNCPMCEARGN